MILAEADGTKCAANPMAYAYVKYNWTCSCFRPDSYIPITYGDIPK